jgi:hypothetical protein
MSFGNFVKQALPIVGGALGGPFGAVAGGLGSAALSSFGGSSSGGGSAGNMGGMAQSYLPKPITSRYAGDPAKFLEAFTDGAFNSKTPAWAEEEINRMLTPSQRSALLSENEDFQNIVGFEYDPAKRRELASVFSKGALGGKEPTSNFLDRLVDSTAALGINDPFGMQRAAEQAAAFDPRAPKIASKQQRQMEAMYGQFNPENSKYLVGYPMQGVIDGRIESA